MPWSADAHRCDPSTVQWNYRSAFKWPPKHPDGCSINVRLIKMELHCLNLAEEPSTQIKWHLTYVGVSTLSPVGEHTQEGRICRSDNQSPFHRTPPFPHVGSRLHSRPTYSLEWQRERGEENAARVRESRERDGIINCFGTPACLSNANTAISANWIEHWRKERWEDGGKNRGWG